MLLKLMKKINDETRLPGDAYDNQTIQQTKQGGHCEQRIGLLSAISAGELLRLNIRGETSLEDIIEAVRFFLDGNASSQDMPRMNILLSGPPGTGKTEFVKYLGKRLELPVVTKMGSSILEK